MQMIRFINLQKLNTFFSVSDIIYIPTEKKSKPATTPSSPESP